MLIVALTMMVQAVPAVDPLSQKVHQFCRARPACVAGQFRGVRRFLNVISLNKPPRPVTQRCLDRATRKGITNWSKAASCMAAWKAKQKPRPSSVVHGS